MILMFNSGNQLFFMPIFRKADIVKQNTNYFSVADPDTFLKP